MSQIFPLLKISKKQFAGCLQRKMWARTSRTVSLLGHSQLRQASTNTAQQAGAFGNNRREVITWAAKTAVGCTIAGLALSATVLNDDNMAPVYEKMEAMRKSIKSLAKDYGTGLRIPLTEAHAFSLPDHGLHPPHYPWDHHAWWKSYDHASLRRGYQVYRDVCAACHSLERVAWRNLIGVTHTEAEIKAMSAEYEYADGPNDAGEMFMRPGKPSDYMPKPYPNEEAARAANAGAYPPDLSCIVRARHGEEDYIMALLLGYYDAPAGFKMAEGKHYNPYFPGGSISMARALYDEVVDYSDGTTNTASQLAKDVATFLSWTSYPEHDDRKKMGLKTLAISAALMGLSVWWKRFKWSYIKSRKIVYRPSKSIEV
ncbi:hypothetical protein SmJEL517_g05896 [Synchytrium microbalum]|uniref:quinol--cytochrome-c reductase n=1 Tax=Synchytrium microbalum TaxID=1806994 RepID=A0A507BXV6_9FUNG|nr:uncharacterized protein SmJEL517_g05896 [Synchytrium microbalum]TPX30556.1 hypothetical protein SmJEL517_g05896 [Synchytrium microbalum]